MLAGWRFNYIALLNYFLSFGSWFKILVIMKELIYNFLSKDKFMIFHFESYQIY